MSWQAMGAVQTHSRYQNTAEDFVPFKIMMAIAWFADHEGVVGAADKPQTCPSIRTIADRAHVHRNSVLNFLPVLAEAGELSYTVHGRGRGRHITYRILLPMDDVPIGQSIGTRSEAAADNGTQHQADDRPINEDIGTQILAKLDLLAHALAHQSDLLAHGIGTYGTWLQADDVPDRLIDPDDPDADPGERESPPPPFPPPPLELLGEVWGEEPEESDEPTTNPLYRNAPLAAVLYHELSGFWPGEENHGYLVERLGSNPDEVALSRAITLWRANGHPLKKLPGVCDWYDEIRRDPGWTPGDRFKPKVSANGSHGPPGERKLSRSEQAAAEYAAEKAKFLGLDTT